MREDSESNSHETTNQLRRGVQKASEGKEDAACLCGAQSRCDDEDANYMGAQAELQHFAINRAKVF